MQLIAVFNVQLIVLSLYAEVLKHAEIASSNNSLGESDIAETFPSFSKPDIKAICRPADLIVLLSNFKYGLLVQLYATTSQNGKDLRQNIPAISSFPSASKDNLILLNSLKLIMTGAGGGRKDCKKQKNNNKKVQVLIKAEMGLE